MDFRPYIIKIISKSKSLARRFRWPTRVLPHQEFYGRRWNGNQPRHDYFSDKGMPRFFFEPSDLSEYQVVLKERFPESSNCAIERASNALANVFSILGCDNVFMGDTVDWHIDFKSGRRWDRKPFARLKLVYPDDNSDVKMPWELSRLQFLVDLGRAYFITENNAYKEKFKNVVQEWEKANPVDIGVNWSCSMEIAIRAINIIWGMHYFKFDENEADFVRNAIRLIYYHAHHIEKNLEFVSDGANSNHLVSNYLGLFYVGLLFPQFDCSPKWKQLGLAGLENEIRAQVLNDGADYEGSTSYHRLVLEIYLSAYLLGRKNDVTFSEIYGRQLKLMIAFSEAVTGNSGLAPLIGDNDDGYIVKLSSDNPADHRPLIDIGLAYFEDSVSPRLDHTEEKLWYLGLESFKKERSTKTPSSKLFLDSGYAVMRNERVHLVLNAFAVPPDNLGGHKHNDVLSFTYEIDGMPYLIDPGTYCYSSDFKLRNLSRSTEYHNTVIIDSEEQNRFMFDRLFFMMRDAETKLHSWDVTDDQVTASVSHTGYARLVDGIIHRRTLTVSFKDLSVVAVDEFDGSGNVLHKFTSNFMTPCLEIERARNAEIFIKAGRNEALKISNSLGGFKAINIDRVEYFPHYGVKKPGFKIEFRYQSHLPFRIVTAIAYNDNDAFNSELSQGAEAVLSLDEIL
jgi:uncharacterized heparinase superfamily protein